MFRLEKVFQNDDKSFVLFTNILKSFAIFSSIYIYSILENRSIYQLLDFNIFINSKYFEYAIFFPIIFFIIITFTNKEQINKFLDVLKLEYDYVIVDSPPVQPVSDTLILTQASDYNLFVIRSEETKTSSFMSSIKKIQNVGAKIDGIIINDLDTSKDSYYSYYYNYTADYYNKV